MRADSHFASATNTNDVLSFASRERRAQRELLALCGAVVAALATVAVSLSGEDTGLAASSAPAPVESARQPGADGPLLERGAGSTRAPAWIEPSSDAPQSDDAPSALAARPRAPRTQAEYAAGLRAISDDAKLLEAIDAALDVERPAALSFAALEVSYARLGERSADHFLRAARELTQSSPNAESVGRASVAWLAQRAPQEPVARHVLAQLAQCYELTPNVRAASGVALVQSATVSELQGLEHRLLRDRDEHVGQCVEAALRSRRGQAHDDPVALENQVRE